MRTPALLALLLVFVISGLCAQEDISGYLEDLTEENGVDVWERLEDLKTDPVSLNRATAGDLLLIPWIDSILAGRIIRFRETRGKFTKLSQLKKVEGMNEFLYREIVPCVKIEPENKFLARIDTRRVAGRGDLRMRLSGSGSRFRTAFKVTKKYQQKKITAGYIRMTPPFSADLSVTAGDLYLSLGQGLLAWSAFGSLRSPENPVVYPFSGRSVRGTTGTSDNRILRGGAVSLSRDSFDVNFTHGSNDAGTDPGRVSSFDFGLRPREKIRIRGSFLTTGKGCSYVAGMSEVTLLRQLRWFTEIAKKSGTGNGVLTGLEKSHGSTAFVFLYRRLSHDYVDPFGFDMSLGGEGIGNLEAAYFGLVEGKGGKIAFSIYRDFGRQLFPEAGSHHARLDEVAACVKTRPARKRPRICSVAGRELDSSRGEGDRESRWKIRWDWILRPASNVILKTRAQIQVGDETENETKKKWRSSLLYVEVKSPLPAGIEIRIRFTSYRSSEGT